MMTTKKEQILSHLATLFGDVGIPVTRNRVEPFSKGAVPAIAIESGKGTPTFEIHGFIDWVQEALITIYVKGDELETQVDPYIKNVHKKLMSDKSLNGLSMDISISDFEPTVLDADTPIGIYQLTYLIKFRTLETDLTQ